MISKYIGKGLFGALLILLLSLGVTRGEGLPGVKVMTLPSSVAGVPGGSLWPSRPGLDEQVASLPLFNPGAKPDLSWPLGLCVLGLLAVLRARARLAPAPPQLETLPAE
jgi:hypothetical protein